MNINILQPSITKNTSSYIHSMIIISIYYHEHIELYSFYYEYMYFISVANDILNYIHSIMNII